MGTYNQFAGRDLDRLAALSDGLFAFAMTVIVLEIRVPAHAAIHSEQDVLNALMALAPRAVTWLLSFLTLGIFWVGQQTQLSHFTRADRNLSWLHLAFLAAVAVMPFSTQFLAEFIGFRTALGLYWLNVLMLGALLYAAWRYARRAGLVKEDVTAPMVHAIESRILIGQALYAFGAALCVINTYWSIGFIVAVQLNYAIAPKIPLLSRLTA